MPSEEIYNHIKVNDEIITSGQPTVEQIRSLMEEGFTNVINLATFNPGESLEKEAELVVSLGMNYFWIPVVWTNPQPADFEAFEHTMLNLPGGKTLIHCHANYRVTAFYSLYAQKHLGWSAQQAQEFRARIWKDSYHPVWESLILKLQPE